MNQSRFRLTAGRNHLPKSSQPSKQRDCGTSRAVFNHSIAEPVESEDRNPLVVWLRGQVAGTLSTGRPKRSFRESSSFNDLRQAESVASSGHLPVSGGRLAGRPSSRRLEVPGNFGQSSTNTAHSGYCQHGTISGYSKRDSPIPVKGKVQFSRSCRIRSCQRWKHNVGSGNERTGINLRLQHSEALR
jgi:hypothetical protein